MGSPDEGLEKFPDLDLDARDGAGPDYSSSSSSNPAAAAYGAGGLSNGFGKGFPKFANGHGHSNVHWDHATPNTHGNARYHGRQKSLSEAIRTIRTRSGSTTQNVHEIADALKAPISPTLIILCVLWYSSSALTNTSSKSILNAFPKPATLTLVQFAFVSFYCIVSAWLASVFPSLKRSVPALRFGIRRPSREVIRTTLPLAMFQIGGHLLSSSATSKIPVSLVHTIKGLSPLFTVVAYRVFFDIRYPTTTYLSLVPLTLGVMLACSGSHSFGGGQQTVGLVYALVATVIFVTQNIFSKRLFNEASRAEAEGGGGGGGSSAPRKLDKLNLLCYSSGMAFLVTVPIWFWSEGASILGDFLWDGSVDLSNGPDSFDHGRLLVEFVFNGFFHFAQNILAFVLLSLVSPVTYSVASLLKRVFVIGIAILWFRSPTTKVQAVGIALTFLGLYFYDRTNENKADRRARTMTDATKAGAPTPLLPLSAAGGPLRHNAGGPVGLGLGLGLGLQTTTTPGGGGGGGFEHGVAGAGPVASSSTLYASPVTMTGGYGLPGPAGDKENYKKSDDFGREPGRRTSATWIPPRTRQEDTWRVGDGTAQPQAV